MSPALQRFCTLADCFSVGQQCATLCEQLLAFGRRNKSATDAVEKLEAKLPLEILNLSR